MKASVYYENGPPSVLRYEDVPDPDVGPGDVLIEVQAISVEGGDILGRKRRPLTSTPYIVGYQAAGVVRSVGAEVTNVRPGQRVAAFNWYGSHAALFCVPTHFVYPIPDELTIVDAVAIPVTFGTADYALFEFPRLKAGETVLIQGGAGGVGLAAVQLAKQAGARVIATASSDERLARLAGFGMDEGINYRTQDIADETMRLTDGQGAEVVVDLAGGTGVKSLFAAASYRGRIVMAGAASGELPSIEFSDLMFKSLSLFSVAFGRDMHLPSVHEMIARHMAAAAAGRLRMPIDRTFPLFEASAAHTHVEQGHPFGRVLLVPEPGSAG